jgi:hypothetical protein
MRKFIGTGLAILALSGAVASEASAASAPTSASVGTVATKGWPRAMDRAFMNACGGGRLCKRALHWLERHYSMRQVARHAGDQRWINNVALEAYEAVT